MTGIELRKIVRETGKIPEEITHVDGYLDLRRTAVTDLGELEHVGGYLDLEGTGVTDLGKLKHVGGSLDLRRTGVPHVFFEPAGKNERTGPVFKMNGEALVQLGCFRGNRTQAVDAIREKYGPDSDYEKIVTAAFDKFERM